MERLVSLRLFILVIGGMNYLFSKKNIKKTHIAERYYCDSGSIFV